MQCRSAWLWVYVLCISGWVLPQASLGQTAAKAPDAAQAQKPALVYRGEPIVVPLECDYEDLLNAGVVCNEDSPCRLFLDLVAVGGGGGGQSVFPLGNIHSSGGTVTSILLASDDEGATWREAAERMRGASLEQILFADGAIGSLSSSRVYPVNSYELGVAGTGGALKLNVSEGPILFARHGEKSTAIEVPSNNGLTDEIAHFIGCIQRGEAPKSDGMDGRRVVAVAAAAHESARTGKRVEVPVMK